MKKKYTLKPTLAYICYRNNKEGYYVARVPILKITNYGKTPSEALHKLAEMEKDTIAFDREMGNHVPTYEESLAAREALKRGGARKNGGRKPIGEGASTVIQVIVSAEERAAIEREAAREKKTVSSWARIRLTARLPRR